MSELRVILSGAEKRIDNLLKNVDPEAKQDVLSLPEGLECRQIVEDAGNTFLALEKYVNLNFMGFIKILKKHDKRLPNPCRAFYTSRLHEQSWVRGDFSDVMVSMSRIYSKLRKDNTAEAKDTATQQFVRSTRKYWVHTEDISEIKYAILQHLPVLLQSDMGGETDSQLTTSIYLDNYAMELYKGRLDKTPGAIALRLRWYGNKSPETVFVERKTHREKWMGEMSVKERFTIKESQVMDLLQERFSIEEEIQRLRTKGKKEKDIDEYKELATEITHAISAKQLFPTMRTQYMRTAFQIPFDATVRISLDTNLTLITERTSDILAGERWYRDPKKPVPFNEIHRFPHAVLEVKLQLQEEGSTPQWVTDLLNSGKLLEVHKFSKFIQGCAVLLPEDVPALPYWIDDVTLADSITKSGAGHLLRGNEERRNNPILPHDAQGNAKIALELLEKQREEERRNRGKKTLVLKSPIDKATAATSPSYSTPPATMIRSPLHSNAATTAAGAVIASSEVNHGANGIKKRGVGYQSEKTTYEEDSAYHRMNDDGYDLEAQHKGHGQAQSGFLCCCCGCLGGGGVSEDSCCADDLCLWAQSAKTSQKTTAQKVEPKVFFANERTFITWLNMAVFMSSMSVAVMAFSSDANASSLSFALMLMPLSLLFIFYALRTYLIRGTKINLREDDRYPLIAFVLRWNYFLAHITFVRLSPFLAVILFLFI